MLKKNKKCNKKWQGCEKERVTCKANREEMNDCRAGLKKNKKKQECNKYN